MDYRILLAGIAITIGIAGILPYTHNLLRNKTKPHVFSWIVWAILSGTAFVAQLSEGGGAGAWSTGVISTMCAFIAVISLVKGGNTYITKSDWLCLIATSIGIALWILTKNALGAVIIVTLTDAIGFIPTFRKGYHKPHEETSTVYIAGTIQNLLAIMALSVLNVTTILYPASLVLTNSSFALLLFIRRAYAKEKVDTTSELSTKSAI